VISVGDPTGFLNKCEPISIVQNCLRYDWILSKRYWLFNGCSFIVPFWDFQALVKSLTLSVTWEGTAISI
jgi:hypothetical protein